MKKKFVVAASFLLAISSLQVMAQQNKKVPSKVSIVDENVVIESKNDTISYSYGATLAGSGMKDYLQQLGIAGDPEKMDAFIKGFNESLPSKGAQSAYISGLGIGDQVYKMATQFSKDAFEKDSINNMNVALIAQGIMDVLNDKTPQVDNANGIMENIMKEASDKKEEAKKAQYKTQVEAGEKFMAENKTKEGVVTLPSGLQYKIVTKGEGEIPALTDQVSVMYKGTLLDGTEFDSNYGREPISLGVGQVIPGWTEALQLMPVGSKWILYIPSDLAYGARDTGPIPPYSNLIFEVELLSIDK